jgi:hypothetical protein
MSWSDSLDWDRSVVVGSLIKIPAYTGYFEVLEVKRRFIDNSNKWMLPYFAREGNPRSLGDEIVPFLKVVKKFTSKFTKSNARPREIRALGIFHLDKKGIEEYRQQKLDAVEDEYEKLMDLLGNRTSTSATVQIP